jgi:hypothetical protein
MIPLWYYFIRGPVTRIEFRINLTQWYEGRTMSFPA